MRSGAAWSRACSASHRPPRRAAPRAVNRHAGSGRSARHRAGHGSIISRLRTLVCRDMPSLARHGGLGFATCVLLQDLSVENYLKHPNRGGRRIGAGSKPRDPEGRPRVWRSVMLAPDAHQATVAAQQPGEACPDVSRQPSCWSRARSRRHFSCAAACPATASGPRACRDTAGCRISWWTQNSPRAPAITCPLARIRLGFSGWSATLRRIARFSRQDRAELCG